MDSEVDLTGRRVGRYEIRSLLGRGGMGAVYRAHDSNLDRSVAIKILPPHLVTDSERVRRFMQEAKSASALNHPHVISIYEIGQDDSVHYIAMELVEGTTLRDRIGGTPLDVKRALVIGEEIAEAIGAAHEAGVVHRDLKPENVIVATAGYVKVLDFGLAKLRRDNDSTSTPEQKTAVMSTEPGKIMGTVGYMSPEQAEGKQVDHRTDIFSLGCILYEMASGRSPFRGRTPVDTLHNILHAEPAPLRTILPDIPFELQRIISKTLAKAPEERYQSAKDLAVDLRRLLRELDSNTSHTQDYGYTPKGTRSRRLAFAALGALLVAIAVAFVIMRRPRETAEAAPPKAPLTIRRITSTGNAIGAVVSPDGKYVSYASSEQGQQGISLRQLATGQDLQLVPPAPVGIWGQSFSPDGASIYYVIMSKDHPEGTLFSISILGGRPQKILDGIDSPVTFSPDGRKIAYVRDYYRKTSSALLEANRDGTGMRVLAKRSAPDHFSPIFYTGPSWSPDGKRIAAAVGTWGGSTPAAKIIAVDVATGAESVISSGWGTTQQVAWLPDGQGLIAIGARRENVTQVWHIPWPSGEPRQITNDLFDYRMASVTADGSTIVTVAADVDADLWHVPTGAREAPRKLRGGKAVGMGGISVAPDGSIAYASFDSTNPDIWITDAGGSTARQVTNSPDIDTNPSFTPDGKTIVFSRLGANATVQRIAADGSQTRASEIVATTYGQPVLSPDGGTLVFGTTAGGLAKMPVTGGAASPLTDYPVWSCAVSPDGARIACYCRVREGAPIGLCIIPMSGGAPERTFDAAGHNSHSMIHWTPDGRALLMNTTARDRRNIWRFPLDGGEPKALTNFTDQILFQFALTPDRKAFIASRGDWSRDAVMITGFR